MSVIYRLHVTALIALSIIGCSESVTPTDDAGADVEIEFDAPIQMDTIPTDDVMVPDGTVPDVGRDDADTQAVCGNGNTELGEQCDDGNTAPGDGCDDECRREAFCGDGNTSDDEVCDDGNNRSGDGCRSDCLSDETCGNGIRDVVVGEVCDDGNTDPNDGCAADCRAIPMCGDGDAVAPEECDDMNNVAWDGCGIDCRVERSLVIDSLQLGSANTGCDFSGDGMPDNNLADALGPAVSLLNQQISGGVGTQLILLMSMLGLDDAAAQNDDQLTIAWFQGEDADGDPMNNLTGFGVFNPGMGAFDMNGNPETSFASSIANSMLSGGPEDVQIPLGFLPLEFRAAQVSGTTVATNGELSSLNNGLLCGGVPVGTFAFLPNIIGMFTGMEAPACDPAVPSSNLADVLIAGTPAGFIFPIGGNQPDVDLDGDGLERYVTVSSGAPGCQPVIVACIDGDGTQIDGHDCTLDPRMADGFSAAMNFTAVAAEVRVAP